MRDRIYQPLKDEEEQKTEKSDDTAFFFANTVFTNSYVCARRANNHFRRQQQDENQKKYRQNIVAVFFLSDCSMSEECGYISPVPEFQFIVLFNKNTHCQQNFKQDNKTTTKEKNKLNSGVSVFFSSFSFGSSISFHVIYALLYGHFMKLNRYQHNKTHVYLCTRVRVRVRAYTIIIIIHVVYALIVE